MHTGLIVMTRRMTLFRLVPLGVQEVFVMDVSLRHVAAWGLCVEFSRTDVEDQPFLVERVEQRNVMVWIAFAETIMTYRKHVRLGRVRRRPVPRIQIYPQEHRCQGDIVMEQVMSLLVHRMVSVMTEMSARQILVICQGHWQRAAHTQMSVRELPVVAPGCVMVTGPVKSA